LIKILETAQKNELRTLVENVKELLEQNFEKKLKDLGILRDDPNRLKVDELVEYELLESDDEKEKFMKLQALIWSEIEQESRVLGEWSEAYSWYLDKMVYTFFNRIFAIRVMEELALLRESTLVPQADLGNRSARMKRIQEQHVDKNEEQWHLLMLEDAFNEINEDVKVIFDENDPYIKIWPDGTTIETIIKLLNDLSPEIYKAEDCIGWFYHYYVLKFRKGHKTMSAHGGKSPKNPYYLSILNTVYTPRWMVRVLVDNSLGHWWTDLHPDSKVFLDSPYLIKKIPVKIKSQTDALEKLRILDPACGSGNFLVYAFGKLLEMYLEARPDYSITKIITYIIRRNLYGIDINRRPAQLSALALYIMAKRTLKERALNEFSSFKMPPVNILCCDIRTPSDENKILLLQRIKDERVKKIIKDIINQFNNADELGTLINIKELQKEINQLSKTKQKTLDAFSNDGNNESIDLVKIIDEEIFFSTEQDIGLQIFGSQTRKALTLARALMRSYDIIVGNPPFGLMIDSTKETLRRSFPNSHGDLVSSFIEQSLRLSRKNGYIGMVSDFSFLHLPKFEKFRANILLTKFFIQYLFMIGYGSLPDAGNRPVLFILRNVNEKKIREIKGFYRNINYDLNKSFSAEFYSNQIIYDINIFNDWKNENYPKGWNAINQQDFLALPRSVIDLNIAEKFKPLIEFFTKYPRLDISQHSKKEKEVLPETEIARVFQGIATGNNDIFVRLWHEINPEKIRRAEKIDKLENVPNKENKQFVPFSKGGGDIRYYLNNCFLLWWDANSIKKIKENKGVIRNPPLMGQSHIHWSLSSGKPRGRFNISQNGLVTDVASMGIHILTNEINAYTLLAYLNSKFGCFLGRLQTKDRKWQAGNIARFPIPIEFLNKHENTLKTLSKESFDLRRDWDTGYPMSPIFSESLADKVIKKNASFEDFGIPKTGHPFCEDYSPCKGETAQKINEISVNAKNSTIKDLFDAVEQRFEILTNRLDEIDDEINEILYELIDDETVKALNEYHDTFVGKLIYKPEREIWLKDFLMANLMEIVKKANRGAISLNTYKEDNKGLYDAFLDLLCRKFERDMHSIQPILKELKDLLGKDLKKWIREDFFFYHCQRFGGRPIIWQFSSSIDPRSEGALDVFINYHQLDENTLPMIRVDYVQPILKLYEQRKNTGVLPEDEMYKINELNEFQKSLVALEKGYENIPNPNSLTGKKAQKGKGDDKTWEWVFSEAEKVIKNGYKPDLFKGVLINLIPLCLDLPENKKGEFDTTWRFLCPKGTIKYILKKINALDQLKQVSTSGETSDKKGTIDEQVTEGNNE